MNGLYSSQEKNPSDSGPNLMTSGSAATYKQFENPGRYTTLRTHPDMASGHNIWLPDHNGIIPKDTIPPRYEFKHLSEHVITFDHLEQNKFTDKAGDVTLKYSHRIWGEFFGGLQLIIDFFVSFILELFGFVLKVVSHLVLGLMIRFADFLVKPLLVFVYNAFVVSSLNMVASLIAAVVQIVHPILDIFQRGAEILAIVFRSFRLCEYNKNKIRHLKELKEQETPISI